MGAIAIVTGPEGVQLEIEDGSDSIRAHKALTRAQNFHFKDLGGIHEVSGGRLISVDGERYVVGRHWSSARFDRVWLVRRSWGGGREGWGRQS